MKRLLEETESSTGMERLTELVNAAEATRPNPFAKRRILLRLQKGSAAHRPLWQSWGVAAGLVFIVGSAVAGAGWWRARELASRPHQLTLPHDVAAPPAPLVPPRVGARSAEPPSTSDLAVPAPAPATAPFTERSSVGAAAVDLATRGSESPAAKAPTKRRASTPVEDATASRGVASASRGEDVNAARSVANSNRADDSAAPSSLSVATPAPNAATPSINAESGEDPTPVVRAIRALRTDRNPAAAEALLQDYLRSHPRGALAEDAVALLIETASAMRSPSASERATRYLELYPNGRYRATARRVLAARP